jgi:membrane fusion protein, heavy metal efflux system
MNTPRAYAILSAVIALFAILTACSREETQQTNAASPTLEQHEPDGSVVLQSDSPKLKEIRIDTVHEQQVPFDEVVSPGKIEVNPNRVSRITLPVAGRVTTVLVKLGDAVTPGQPLLTLEGPDADAAESGYRQAQAALTQARSNLNKAQADYDRSNDLFEHNAIAKKDVLTSENALAQAKAALEQAQAALDQAARRLAILGLKPGAFGQKVTVSSPISGKVLEMSVAAGEYHNDTNAPVMTIADLSTVWVSSDVPESQIRFIDPGERIDVSLTAYPGETFHGRVTRIADTVDPQTRTIKVRAEMDNARGRLRPEMFGTIRHTDSFKTMPVVPPGAVVQEQGKTLVWMERGTGRFQPVQVRAGDRNDGYVPILNGLRSGDRIVVDGTMLLRAQ